MSLTEMQRTELQEEFGMEAAEDFIGLHGDEFLASILDGGIDAGEIEKFIDEHGEEKIKSALDCGVSLDDIGEAYQGGFGSDREFAMEMADQISDLPKDMPWPYTCIDWGHAAQELMMDYSESGGHYWRNL